MPKDQVCKQCPYIRGVAVENTLERKDHQYLSMVASFKNEEYLLNEWIPFHILQGVEHFYLYNDQSDDRSAEIVQPYVDQGIVTMIPWSRFINVDAMASPRQLLFAYAHAIASFGHLWRWMAFVDLDEFLFSKQGSLIDSLKDYERYPSVVVPWHMFGTNGFKKRPDGLVIENFTHKMRFPTEDESYFKLNNWKSIVDPMAVNRVKSPHTFGFKNSGIAGRNEDHEPVKDIFEKNFKKSEVFQLNHYFSLSEEDFFKRRGVFNFDSNAAWADPAMAKDERIKMVQAIDSAPQELDEYAANFTPKVKSLIAR